MKKRPLLVSGVLLSLLLCLGVPTVFAQQYQVKSDTLMRVYQRDTLTATDVSVLPLYEYLRADVEVAGVEELSFHLYGWGRADLGDGNYFEDDTEAKLLYGYVDYRRDTANLLVRVGRQYVFSGIANDSLDGALVRADLGPMASFSAYGGLPVALDSVNARSGDVLYGGRFSLHRGTLYDLGLSYKKSQNDSETFQERMGVDLALGLPAGVQFNGLSVLNIDSSGWAEHSYELRIPAGSFSFRPYFQSFVYEDYFGTSASGVSLFNALAARGDANLSILGGDLNWYSGGRVSAGLKVKSISNDSNAEDAVYTGGLLSLFGKGMNEVGAEFGYMDGDSDDNSYLLARAYFYLNRLPRLAAGAFLSGDMVYALYDEPIYNEDFSLFASLGLGMAILQDRLQIKLSGDYSQDPYFDKDMRGMLVVSYLFGR
ncbi:MAG: hypothetical protein AB7F21_00625 [Desulfuromonadales bacterium]